VVDRALLRENLDLAPAQPATALWRAIETEHVLASRALPKEGRGLDLGCGDGAITALVANRMGAHWNLVGLDPDGSELQLAADRGLYERLDHAEGSSMPEADESFDFVFSNSVLEHVDAIEETLTEIGRILKPSGHLIFTVPSEFFPRCVGRPGLLGAFVTGTRSPEAYQREIDRRVYHLRYWSVPEWQDALARWGLEVIDTSYYMTRRETRRWAALSNATAGLLVRLTGRTKRPIEIQRRLGLRRGKAPVWLRGIGRVIGEVGAMGLERAPGLTGRGSCLLIVARKIASRPGENLGATQEVENSADQATRQEGSKDEQRERKGDVAIDPVGAKRPDVSCLSKAESIDRDRNGRDEDNHHHDARESPDRYVDV
jgi:SAM-dependent methyltransferase